ncbi:MAG: hypothetical protein K2L87_07465, partial [Clostridiales bacterium]|nr:hypothetical protein [Clostridiales bacterium]
MNRIETLLKHADMRDYAPVPFWSWNNQLNREELIRQIDEMKSVGCGGFVLHARTGLKTEYLSKEWFSLVEACLDAAKERNMNVWIYDENGWPSGFVGGALLNDEKNLAAYLLLEERETFDPSAFAVFVNTDGKYERVTAPKKGAECYYTVIKKLSPSNTDILNPDVVEKFIAATHEQYYARFADRFGKELVGFFTDEPQFFRGQTPYAPALEGYFKEHFNEDVKDNIISLFSDGEEYYSYRVRYYTALNELYVETFYKRMYAWCEEHGCKLTGHSIEENKLFTQMWGSAGVSSSYEFEHIPAIDNLGMVGPAKLSARQVGSVAAQLGKRQILTETFGCCGYVATPKQLKAIVEKQYVHGVNLLCHHLYSYSLAGQGKVDHPPCFSRHMTWWKQFPQFNQYVTRLGYLLANSTAQVNVVAINPMSSVYLRYDVRDESLAMRTDGGFDALQQILNDYAVEYEIADEHILARHGKVSGKALTIGRRKYSYVVVPDCENLSKSTKEVLEAYVKAGGKILAINHPNYTDGVKDDWSFLQSNTTLKSIAADRAIKINTDGIAEYTYRKSEQLGFEFLYVVNPENTDAQITLPKKFSRLDLNTLIKTEQPGLFTLPAGEGVILVPEAGKKPTQYAPPHEMIRLFSCAEMGDNNLTLDIVHLSKDGKKYGEEEPIVEAFDRLLREEYSGKLFVKYTFRVNGVGRKLILRREKGKYDSATLNGMKLDFHDTAFDCMFEEADIMNALKVGENEYVCEMKFFERPEVYYALFSPDATESMRNCLSYDTEIENIYLLGNFTVDENRAICAPYLPDIARKMNEQGYPYFAGTARFHAIVRADSELAKLSFRGQFSAVEVIVNGVSAGSCFQNESVEVPMIKGEDNVIELAISSTLRNMFGPFHWA